MKGSYVPLLASFASSENSVNRWATADFADQNGPVDVPNNRWGGNSVENVNYEPRREKSPTELKFFVKSAPGSAFFAPEQLEPAEWVARFSEEFDTNEVATNFTDADGNKIYKREMNVFNTDYWEFAQTETERENNWRRGVNSCGQHRELSQQEDVNCPNVVVINTDDMSWADLSVNNPSKLIPTPNLDRLVSKGINFRDGHSCTARCAPSRYCLMTGRHSWRRGDYHYKPMYLEHGRKIIPQMFKRAGYRTYLVGKAQPTEAKITKIFAIDHYTECRVTGSNNEEFGDEDANEERRRKRRETGDFQRLVYNGGSYDPAVNDFMYMDVGEDGEAMDNTAQRVCWFGADVLLRNECEESWRCLPKRFNAAQYESCINDCLAGSIAAGLDERYAQIEATSCPSRQGFCDPSNTDYKNFALQEGVLKWGYDTGFNSFSYCCYPGAAFFRDDYNIEALRSYGIYVDIRDDAHMYNDNLRIRDDWISKNMQYIIGRSGLFKHFQGASFRPWSGHNYEKPDRYTGLTVERATGAACSDLSEANMCAEPEPVSQCDWFDAVEDTLRTAESNRPSNLVQFFNDQSFKDILQALEASFFTMSRNETVALNKFAFVERIIVEDNSLLSSRARTEQEIADDMINVMGPWPDHDGGEFVKIDPTFTVPFFKDYAARGKTSQEKNARRGEVESYIMDLVRNMLNRIDLIRDIELSCDDRRRRDTSANLRPQAPSGDTSFNPAVAMKLLVRGNIKSMDQETINPNLNATEFQQLRENYEFSSNMYKFIYSADSADIIEAPYGAEGKPRHFHSKAEAKDFVDRVADAFLQYQGIEPDPENGEVNPETGERSYTNDQRARFKLWEWAHTRKYGGYGFNAPRTQPSFDSREVMKNFHEEASKNFVEAKHHIAEKNQPFFMYLAFRAPHRPFSHVEEYDYARPGGFIGKAGEQLREFDDRIGMLMKTLEDLNIADNTFVMFTSDNGPDGSGFANQDFQGHVRFGTLRGKKASVFEGGHRVPFLVWWPKGTDRAIWGSNYDLPVGQLDLFSTFADMIKYPLPSAEKCTYAYDTTTPPIRTNRQTRSLAEIKREQAWVHAEAAKFPELIVNDASAFWSIETLRIKCNAADSAECPCDNWTNENNAAYNRLTTDICYHRNVTAWKVHDLGTCHCKPLQKDCPDGYCFSRILAGSTKEDMTEITGGRHAINKLFYRENGDYVGPWDSMSPDEQRDFRRGLESVHMYHQFLTLEEKTGLVLGFDGCMAEDSHSFLDAFKASDEAANTGKFHRRPAEIFGGKLGDLSLRMGRYKLVRWNPPKDRRTGPNAQHLRPNNEAEWPRDENGGKNDKAKPDNWQDADIYEKCTWAPVWTEDMENPYLSNLVMQRKNIEKNHTDNQRWMCQKDHFYELWDLNINPGERQLCNSEFNVDVWESMREAGSFQATDNPREDGFDVFMRGLGGNTIDTDHLYGLKLQDGKPEKHPDPHGIGSGKESTPVPDYATDCCLVDYGNLEDRPCKNSETDICEQPRNEPIANAAEIILLNAKKAAQWMDTRANVIELLRTFPDDFKDNFAAVDREARVDYWTAKFDAAAAVFESHFDQEVVESTELKENRRLYLAKARKFENLPIFDEGNGECIKFVALRVQRMIRGEPKIFDARLNDMLASDDFAIACTRSNRDFVHNEDGSYRMWFNMKFSRFLFPKSTAIKDYSLEYFEQLAECDDTSCILAIIDNMLDVEHRHDANNNMFMAPEEVVEQSNKRILIKTNLETETFYEPYCPGGCVRSPNCKCPEVATSAERRKRRNTSPNPTYSFAKSIIPRANAKSALRRTARAALPPMNNAYYLKAEHFLWVMDKFEPKLSTFKAWAAENYEQGYRCAESPLVHPSQFTKPQISDIRGRFCKPKAESETLKCKVPEHSGSVGNGFKIVASADDALRFPGAEESIEIKGFGAYAKFAKCMADVMLEIEGAAHYPELDEKLKATAGQEDEALWRQEAKDEFYQFSGLRNGLNPRSLQSRASNVRGVDSSSAFMANEPAGVESQYLHGGGSRYVQPNNDDYYVNGCLKYLEEFGLPSAYTVPGSDIPGSQREEHTVNSILNTENAGDGPGSLDYDMDGSLLGYYPLKQMKRLDGKCVMVPRWLPEREANYVKYGVVECSDE